MSGASVTGALAGLVSGVGDADIPAPAREAARRAVLDTVGVALAGADDPCVRILREALRATGAGGAGEMTLLGRGTAATAPDAALVNGTAAHALDYDDTHAAVRGHPSAVIVPAALAAAELTGASGAELVTAYCLGLEVAARTGRALGPAHAAQGFHSTSTLGVLGAAAASARILGLDAAQVESALGIAASGACGLRLNFGSMTKPLHAGNAARAGLLAASLAQGGFSAAGAVLDAAAARGGAGFAEVFSPGDADPAAIGAADGTWQVLTPGPAVKKYPCCNRGHRAVDAVLSLVRRHAFDAAEVARVEVRMPAGQVDARGRVGPMMFPDPVDGLQAKFSMQYVVAAALLDGAVRIGTFTDAQVARPQVRELLRRVHPVADGTRPATDPRHDYVEVVVVLTGGTEHSARVRFSRGDPRGGVPLSEADLVEKYRDCAGIVLPAPRLGRSLDLFARLEALSDVRVLTAELTCRPA